MPGLLDAVFHALAHDARRDMLRRLSERELTVRVGGRFHLIHDRLDGVLDRHPGIAEQVGPGWESALDALVAVGW